VLRPPQAERSTRSDEEDHVPRSERNPGSTRRAGRLAGALGIVGALVLGAGAAHASPDTLRNALEDIVLGAADLGVSPVTAGLATAQNLDEMSDSWALQALYVVPGWLGMTFVHAGQATLRVAAGALELVPGVLLFPFPGVDVPESFNVFRRDPIVDVQNPLAENPAWLPWVPVITPFTIDVRFMPISPWADFEPPPDVPMGGAAE